MIIKLFHRRVLREDETLWIVIGDRYCGAKKRPSDTTLKRKDLVEIPWMLAFTLRADGWTLRQDIIWHKPNCMSESVRDRCTRSHEYLWDEMVELMVETVCSRKETVRIAGNDFPQAVVKSRLLKLDGEHIRFVFDCLKRTPRRYGT